MAGSKIGQQRTALARFLNYVLGRRPDEFGLFPDEEGYVPLKELLMALSEEEGWRHIREANIRELAMEPGLPKFEIREGLVRAHPGEVIFNLGPYESAAPPKLLYHAARRKGYPVIVERGLTPAGRPYVPLSTTREMALRLGRRRDPDPVLLTIRTEPALERGIVFYRPQELIYLVEAMPADLIVGPPLPKEKPEEDKKKKPEKKPAAPTMPSHPGSFILDFGRDPRQQQQAELTRQEKRKRSDVPDWKRDTRRDRRKKKFEEED